MDLSERFTGEWEISIITFSCQLNYNRRKVRKLVEDNIFNYKINWNCLNLSERYLGVLSTGISAINCQKNSNKRGVRTLTEFQFLNYKTSWTCLVICERSPGEWQIRIRFLSWQVNSNRWIIIKWKVFREMINKNQCSQLTGKLQKTKNYKMKGLPENDKSESTLSVDRWTPTDE